MSDQEKDLGKLVMVVYIPDSIQNKTMMKKIIYSVGEDNPDYHFLVMEDDNFIGVEVVPLLPNKEMNEEAKKIKEQILDRIL